MDMSYLNDEDLLLPEIQFGGRSGGHPSREDEFEDINRLLSIVEYIESSQLNKHRGADLAAKALFEEAYGNGT